MTTKLARAPAYISRTCGALLTPRLQSIRSSTRAPLLQAHFTTALYLHQTQYTTPKMAASDKYSLPSFTALVVDAMRKHYPEELADRRWDNVGLLLGNIETPETRKPKNPVVLLTNDLTYAVAEEAVQKSASVIVSYHPFIFSGLKSITTKDPQQATLLLLAANGIAVYCPHTAVDAAPNGLNTWLGDIVSGGPSTSPSTPSPSTRTVINPLSSAAPAGFEGSGYGLLCTFRQPESLAEIIRRVASRVGMRRVMVASPDPARLSTARVDAVAVCAGSGWDVVKGAAADVIVTGEMTHHNALKAVQEGKTVVTVFHSNSERGYLTEVMKPLLEGELKGKEVDVQVLVSETDRDPFDIVDVSEL
ncbi:Ngg1 interacting factor [Colletotrichum higginsianum IMI 349063]|uniref:Ngg1 interacting factor n=1 Tax=Colletotrichum higginsianum (strain IMI 349063) TaxID=759273 RepID=A0A1B7YVY3_COLHI|nr:Ngg1 interacting factor [Colletotrichum higginsianum IMI 349063]OBR16206.1 Ngg1 interacting factor [Colletotrichum higginsianum IMI 349063]